MNRLRSPPKVVGFPTKPRGTPIHQHVKLYIRGSHHGTRSAPAATRGVKHCLGRNVPYPLFFGLLSSPPPPGCWTAGQTEHEQTCFVIDNMATSLLELQNPAPHGPHMCKIQRAACAHAMEPQEEHNLPGTSPQVSCQREEGYCKTNSRHDHNSNLPATSRLPRSSSREVSIRVTFFP